VSLVVLEKISLSFGGRTIVDGLDLRIGEADRIGLIGRNGSGKSSLLRILAKEQEPDTGVVRCARGVRVGYLPQEIDVVGGMTLLESVLASVPGRTDLERELEICEGELDATSDPDEQMALAEKLGQYHEDILHFDTNWSPHEAHSILGGLGFSPSDAGRDLAEFSGGWKMRAVMAGLLFQRPDLLMLDEPTNHLDIDTVDWLAEFLRGYNNALLLICHDRDFLNEQISRVVSYEAEGVRQYQGDYEEYLRQRTEEKDILVRRAANQARERDQTERFIRRFRSQATKAKAVQSRVKALEKLDDVVVLEEQRGLAFNFPPCARSGQEALKLEGLGHSYGSTPVFSDASLTVRRGEKIAIIGPNGAGKTTLLRILAGDLAATAGRAVLGHNVKPGYYAQHVAEKLDVRRSIFDEVWSHSVLDDLTRVRTILGSFLFSNDDVDKLIGVLSGGEKARVALARLMVDPGNLLLMDEPTNHLDLESAEALAQALESYDGTILFVSHNRSFVRHLATRIVHVHDGGVEEFPGTLDEFLYHLRQRASESAAVERPAKKDGDISEASALAKPDQAAKVAPKQKKPPAAAPLDPAELKRQRAKEREDSKRRDRETKALRRDVADLEGRIAKLETVQGERSAELADPKTFSDQNRYHQVLASYTEDAAKLDELIGRWEASEAELGRLTQ
jgi:ATP-binding cassette subfamily F protein 3